MCAFLPLNATTDCIDGLDSDWEFEEAAVSASIGKFAQERNQQSAGAGVRKILRNPLAKPRKTCELPLSLY